MHANTHTPITSYEHEGISFTLDPIYKDPTDATWREFIRECNKFALAHGGRMALTQVRTSVYCFNHAPSVAPGVFRPVLRDSPLCQHALPLT